MQRRNMCSVVLRLMVVVGVLAGALTVLGCSGGDNSPSSNQAGTVLVAKNDLAVPVTTETVPALENQKFTFDSGEALTPALANQPIAVTFTDTTSATPTVTVTAPNIIGTDGQPASFSAAVEFGSCTFKVKTSTFAPPGPQVGKTIKVDPCKVNLMTGGITVQGNATKVQILLLLGFSPSLANQVTVVIDPTTGKVTITGAAGPFGVGNVELEFITGTPGGSPG